MTRIVPANGGWSARRLADHPLCGLVWHVESRRRARPAELVAALRAARYRLLGELHDHPDHHALQAALLQEIAAGGARPVLAFEQFDREHESALQQRLARGGASPADVAEAVHFDRAGWNWEFYRPLVEIALRQGLPLRAANLSTATARRLVKEGWNVLGTERVAALGIERVWSPESETRLQEIIFEGHCRALPRHLLPGMAAAQRARDATLAEAMRDSGSDGAVLIAGNGHLRRDLGVPLYLSAGRGTICAVGMLEVEEGRTDAAAYVTGSPGNQPLFDFTCFTPVWERPDPCAAFRPRET
ncbi:MAG: ChaN family lipoprotein [Burkholderiales bacterium]|nr:ChaN family lipoprotein [Burkholderiales bacterium]